MDEQWYKFSDDVLAMVEEDDALRQVLRKKMKDDGTLELVYRQWCSHADMTEMGRLLHRIAVEKNS